MLFRSAAPTSDAGDGADHHRTAAAGRSERRALRPRGETVRAGRKPPDRQASGGDDRARLVARLEQLLADTDTPVSRRELASRLGAEPTEVTAALAELRRARLVATVGRGPATRYQLAPTAASARRPLSAGDGDLADRVVTALRAAVRPLTLRELAAALEARVDDVRLVVTALRQNGVVEMVGRRRGARYRARS